MQPMKSTKVIMIFQTIILFVGLFMIPHQALVASTSTSSAENLTSTKTLVFTPQIPGFIAKYVFKDNSTRPIANTIKTIFEYAIKIIGLIAIITTMVGGFIWLSAAGNSQKISEAKQWISSSLIGLLLILFSHTILRTINYNLVNFKVSVIKTIDRINIVYENKTDPRQFHEDNAQKTMTIASSTNPNGVIACCIINTPQTHGSAVFGVQTLNCATYQATYYKGTGSTDSIESLCKQFYESKMHLVPNDPINIVSPLEARKIGARSAAMFVGRCEDSEVFKEICMGKDHKDFCKVKKVGSSCITDDNYWGYCSEQKKCTKCAGYGQPAEHSYQCPTFVGVVDDNGNVQPLKNLANSPQVLGHQCGNDVMGCLDTRNDEKYKRCLCYGSFCYQECINNGGYNGGFWSWHNPNCLNVKPKKRHLYVGTNNAAPDCRQ